MKKILSKSLILFLFFGGVCTASLSGTLNSHAEMSQSAMTHETTDKGVTDCCDDHLQEGAIMAQKSEENSDLEVKKTITNVHSLAVTSFELSKVLAASYPPPPPNSNYIVRSVIFLE